MQVGFGVRWLHLAILVAGCGGAGAQAFHSSLKQRCSYIAEIGQDLNAVKEVLKEMVGSVVWESS